MKYIQLLILVVIFHACSSEKDNSYEEGINRCENRLKELRMENPDKLIGIRPDCLIGYKIPDFVTQTIAGQKIDIGYFKDKSGIINFWFEGCPPCVAEIPFLNKIVDSIGIGSYFYLGIGKDSKEDISAFLTSNPWKFDQVENGNELIDSTFKMQWGYPTNFIVNTEGIITHVFRSVNENNLDEVLNTVKSVSK